MSRRERILAIDVGTQSVRALVFDSRGRLCARVQRAIDPPYESPRPDLAVIDPARLWDTLVSACQALWAEQPTMAGRIAGLALTTQRATSVFIDAWDRPLGPAISWLDRRRAARVPSLPWPMRAAKYVPGAGPLLDQLQRRAPSNWLAAHEPERHARIVRACLLSGFLVHRLTGVWRDATAAQVGYLPFDYKNQRWPKPGDWRWRALSLAPAQMPELVDSGGALGGLTGAAAAALGLTPGLMLYAAGADKACEVLGSGAVSPETACISLGTTATINTCRARYHEVERFMPAYPAAMPGAYNDEIQIDRGFWLVSWFKQEFAADVSREAAARQRPAEALLDEAIAPITPGSDGLVVLPTWSAGAGTPGPEARGAIVGFTGVHTRAHVYRAILEGLAYALRGGRETIEARTRTPIRCLRVAGGGSQSDQALQILADVFGLAAERVHTHEASGLGAAINAAVGLGWYADHGAAVAAMVRTGARFEPRPEAVTRYDAVYREVYAGLYGELRPTLRRLRRVFARPA